MNHKKRIKNKKGSKKRKIYKKKVKLRHKKIQILLKTDIIYMIQSLPSEIQKRIYIMTWKGFWRDYIPITAKPPTWLKYANYIQKTLWESRLNNIHFLHLPFNILPENKKWIMGCQCDYCKIDTEVDIVEKHMYYLIQYRNPYYFSDRFMPKATSSDWNEYLVPIAIDDINDDMFQYVKIFDPLCGSYKENYTSKRLREGGNFEFSYPTM
jgi:hypothetical protein